MESAITVIMYLIMIMGIIIAITVSFILVDALFHGFYWIYCKRLSILQEKYWEQLRKDLLSN